MLTKPKLKWSQRKKLEVQRLLGSKCNHCGESDPDILQFDHTNSDGNINRPKSRKALYDEIRSQPSRYQLLCANCNWKKREIDFKVQRRRKKRIRHKDSGKFNLVILLGIVVLVIYFVYGYK